MTNKLIGHWASPISTYCVYKYEWDYDSKENPKIDWWVSRWTLEGEHISDPERVPAKDARKIIKEEALRKMPLKSMADIEKEAEIAK